MTLNDLQIEKMGEMIVINVAKLLEYPQYQLMPDDMVFGMFRHLDSPFGTSVGTWVGSAIMMTADGFYRENMGLEKIKDYSPERIKEVTKKNRDEELIGTIIAPFMFVTKAEFVKQYQALLDKYIKGVER